MIAKDYRLLKSKNAVSISVDGPRPLLLRNLYNQATGELAQTREDVIDTDYLSALRADLVEQIKDLNRLLIDVGSALEAKAAALKTPVEEEP